MLDTYFITQAHRNCLLSAARELHEQFRGVFGKETIQVVTMGCGDACPLLPGKHYEDWELEDPSGKTLKEIRPIRDQIRDQVTDLLHRLSPSDATARRPHT